MKLMAGMNKDANIARIIGALEVFISTISEIASVFFGEYDGGDFCSGLIFGKDGTVMMLKIAETFIGPPPPEHDPANRFETIEEKRKNAQADIKGAFSKERNAKSSYLEDKLKQMDNKQSTDDM